MEVVSMDSPKEKSHLSNLTGFRDVITRRVDEGTAVNDVHLDSSKASDAVCHNILVTKLWKRRIGEQTVRWIEN